MQEFNVKVNIDINRLQIRLFKIYMSNDILTKLINKFVSPSDMSIGQMRL